MESVYRELFADMEYNRMTTLENIFKKYENIKEDDDIVDLSTMTIISKKKGVKKITEKSLERVYKKTENRNDGCNYRTTSKGLKLMAKIESHIKSGGKINEGVEPPFPLEPTSPVPWATRGFEPPFTMEPTSPVPQATRGTKRRVSLQPAEAAPKRTKCPQPPSSLAPNSPVPRVTRGTKRRVSLQPAEAAPKRTKCPQPPSSLAPNSPVPRVTRGTKRRVGLQPAEAAPKRTKCPQLPSLLEGTTPVPRVTRGAIKRAALQPVGGSSPKRPSSPPPSSTPEPSSPVPLAIRGTKRRAVLQPVGASPKRSKLTQLCPTTEPTSTGPVAARGNGPNSMTARAPVLADKIIEAPSCNRYNLRPRKMLSAVDFSKSRGDKEDHLPKSKPRVRKELPAREGDLLSGSLEIGKFMCDPKICPLTYLDAFTLSLGDVRGGARKFTRRPPVPQNRRTIYPLDSITLMLM